LAGSWPVGAGNVTESRLVDIGRVIHSLRVENSYVFSPLRLLL
jgi:hypothetical protein